jgi:hypothetical protein
MKRRRGMCASGGRGGGRTAKLSRRALGLGRWRGVDRWIGPRCAGGKEKMDGYDAGGIWATSPRMDFLGPWVMDLTHQKST